MRRLAPFLAAVALGSAPSVARAEHVKVFVLSGQSNMVGYGDGTQLPPALASQANVWFDHRNADDRMGGEYAGTASSDWGPLAPKGQAKHYGPELTFGKELALALPGVRIAILKMSQGGTNIPEHWARGLPSDPSFKYKSQLYHALLGKLDSATYSAATNNALAFPSEAGRLDAAIARLQKANPDWELAGFIWMQGENEAGWDAALHYETRLSDLVKALREDTKTPGLPVVVGRVSDNLYAKNGGPIPASADMYVDAVRKAQEDFATKDGHAAWVDTDDLTPKAGDAYHFDSAGYQTLGTRFAKAWLSIAPQGSGGAAAATASVGSSSSGVPASGGAGGGSGGPSAEGAGGALPNAPGASQSGGCSCASPSSGTAWLAGLCALLTALVLVRRSRS